MNPSYPENQFAPRYLQGLMNPPPEAVGYEDRPYEYVYAPSTNGALAMNAFLNPDSLAINTDADFIAAGWYLGLYTGVFQVQLIDSTGYQLQSGMINSGAISQAQSNPTVLSPAHRFPAGGKIQIVIQDLSGSSNPLQIVFKGWKRFILNKAEAA